MSLTRPGEPAGAPLEFVRERLKILNTKEARKIIREILAKLQTEYTPQKVILFGSYAYGHPDRDSDIDLLIVKETSERFIDRWVTVRRILSDPKCMIPLAWIIHKHLYRG